MVLASKLPLTLLSEGQSRKCCAQPLISVFFQARYFPATVPQLHVTLFSPLSYYPTPTA